MDRLAREGSRLPPSLLLAIHPLPCPSFSHLPSYISSFLPLHPSFLAILLSFLTLLPFSLPSFPPPALPSLLPVRLSKPGSALLICLFYAWPGRGIYHTGRSGGALKQTLALAAARSTLPCVPSLVKKEDIEITENSS